MTNDKGLKVLIVDDDKNICDLLRLYLEKDGYSVLLCHDGDDAVVKFKALSPDMVLLDIMLPGKDGWQVCREIRKISNVPIIMITAKGETIDKVIGLELGADDYIVKPFDAKEVIARINAVTRRVGTGVSEPEQKEVHYDKLSVNMDSYELKVNGKIIDTPPKELELLYYLASIRTEFIHVTSFWMRCGDLNITAIHVLLTFISSACVKSWREFQKNGLSKPYGALAISLKPTRKNNLQVCFRDIPLQSCKKGDSHYQQALRGLLCPLVLYNGKR